MESDPLLSQKNLLKKRAEELAKPNKQGDTEESLEVLTFNLSDEFYGIETKFVKEVFPLKTFTILPTAPLFLMGLTNIRRKIISIIDLRVFFLLPRTESSHKKAILISDNVQEFAIFCNEVMDIKTIPLNEMQASLTTLNGIKEEFLKGITREYTVLDGNKLLNSSRLIIDEFVES